MIWADIHTSSTTIWGSLIHYSEKAIAPHSSTLAWKIPWMEEPGRLQSMGSLGVGHDWAISLSFSLSCIGEGMATHSSVLAWKIPGMGEPGGLPSMGSHRVRHDWSDLAVAAAAASIITSWLEGLHKFWLTQDLFLSSIIYIGLCSCACPNAQLCPTLCNPMCYCPGGSSVHGFFQASILEWIAISSSRESSRPRDQTCVSYISCVGRGVLYH